MIFKAYILGSIPLSWKFNFNHIDDVSFHMNLGIFTPI